MINVMTKVENAMPPETVIVGGYAYGYWIRHSNGSSRNIIASEDHQVVALVFVNDKNKPEGVGETQFHSALSSGLRPVGPTYMVASIEKNDIVSELTVRRKGSHENLDGGTILRRAYENFGVMTNSRPLYIGVTKRRKCFVGDEEVEWMTNLEFHEVRKSCHTLEEFLWVKGIEVGDILRFYHPDPTAALSSIANVSNYLRSFKQVTTTDGNKWEVFGGFIFSYFLRCESFFSQPKVNSSPFLDNCPNVPFGGILGGWVLGRGDLTSYAEESQEQKSVRSFMHEWGAIYLIMSYSP